MNVFTTDHPMMQPMPDYRRFRKWSLILLLSYPTYLLLLGPFYGLIGRGFLDFLPESVCRACFLPAAPVLHPFGPKGFYDSYLDWWYTDPIPVETTW